jgi:hypothetical protein
MKPVLALTIDSEVITVQPGTVADYINAYLDREFGEGSVSIRLLSTEDELRLWEAGQLVLYRKPARRFGNTIVYEKNGRRVELVQETAFD